MNFFNEPGEPGRVRVKICGITRVEDALTAAAAGADAIGLVFYEPSPRAVTIEQAQAILEQLPAFVTSVGLFVDADDDTIRSVLNACPLDLLQFHGDEDQAMCARYAHRYIKALRVRDGLQLEQEINKFPDARGILLDTWVADAAGGTGRSFDWSLVPDNIPRPLILAGGLNPDNVRSAIQQVKPWAVDVSGGVEADKGIKDPDRIKSFINEVRNAVIEY